MDQSVEEWRPVVGWEGLYEVSDQGRVRSLDRVVTKSNGVFMTVRGRMLRPSFDRDGYAMVGLSDVTGKRKGCVPPSRSYTVHRLVCIAFHGLPPEKTETCHVSGVKADNRASNLHWGSKSKNNNDKIAHGTSGKGSKHNMAKISEEDVVAIRTAYASGDYTQLELAGLYGLERGHIGSIVRRERWRHVAA
jgi:hypothetical protein